MSNPPSIPEGAGPPAEPGWEWRRRYDELQKRITRFSVVEQELINTRDRLDRELARFERMHTSNTRAIQARSDAALATLVAEAIVDVFELEFGALALGDGRGSVDLTGLDLPDPAKASVLAWLRHQWTGVAPGRARLLGPAELTEVRPPIALQQLIVTACRNASGEPVACLAGGLTEAAAAFHDPVGAGLLESFEVFAQQVSALLENRRHQATIEQQVRQIELSEKRLTLALEGSSAGLWDWDLRAGEVFFSMQWLALLGHTPGELTTAPDEWHRRVHPEDLPLLRADFHAHVEGKTEQFENSHRLRHRDGRYVWMLARGRALREPTGEAYRVVGTHLDISAQKELERLLRETEEAQRLAREQAEAANHAKSAFLATMSHEIRTPLNGVLGAVQLLHDLQLSEDQKQLVAAAEQSAAGLLDIVGDILDLTKIESGRFELELRPFGLPALLREVTAGFEVRVKAKGLCLALDLAEDLPPAVHGDPLRLRQILTNLVGNAIKFTPAGGVTVSVSVKATEAARQWIEFSVRDTGIGIPADIQARLFTAFVQGDSSTTRRFGGTGLGLAISRRLVELMGGEIRVVSEVGKGADFRFCLPLAPAEPPSAPSSPTPTADRFSGRVLVAEDNPIGQRIAPAMLRKMGLTVDLAGNGREAVERFVQNQYDAILMDCQMPEMDGYEATRAIREQEASLPPDRARHVRIIALTANAMGGDRERCLDAGMDDYLTKPFNAPQLQAALCRAFRPAEEPAPPERPPAVPDFNPAMLARLCAELDPESVRGIVRSVIDELPAYPGDLDRLNQENLLPELARAAHSLKGLSLQCGLTTLANLALAIEGTATNADRASLPGLLARLPDTSKVAKAALEAWIEAEQAASPAPPPSGDQP